MNPLRLLLFLLVLNPVLSCHPGRGGIRRRGARKMHPLIYKEHVPSFSEKSLAASGSPNGVVERGSKEFRRLVANRNPDVKFKDEEETGADRIMTQRCKEKLNTLAISVMNQWPGVHLRVIESWDEDFQHKDRSLHYEGRAVDFTTSDLDKAKNGMLARLAVESGFDWVYFENKRYIHASCKSEASSPGKGGGCFPGSSTVLTSLGERKRLSDLKVGESVLSANAKGDLEFSPVLLFLDRDPEELRQFVTIVTEEGKRMTMTPTHLLYAREEEEDNVIRKELEDMDFEVFYARDVYEGMRVLVQQSDGVLRPSRVVAVDYPGSLTGVYAPLTAAGNIVVDGILASCYALVDSQSVAHAAFAPIRWWQGMREMLLTSTSTENDIEVERGVHWYADLLYRVGEVVMPQHLRD